MDDPELETAESLAQGRSERYALLMIWGAIITIGF